MRQYFGDEIFYNSFEKIEWVNKVSYNKNPYISFSPAKPYANEKLLFRHANIVNEPYEVEKNLSVIFGENREIPFITKSIIGRSAMSDGSISPEGTRAFSKGAFYANFPINTEEGGLISNFLATLQIYACNRDCLEVVKGNMSALCIKRVIKFFTNREIARRVYRKIVLQRKDRGTFIFDDKGKSYLRIDWNTALSRFPKEVASSIPDITLQIGSDLYGVRNDSGEFDELRYKKVMIFCKMSEVKIAQGAKQTGGKLLASKVSDDISYYRRVPAYKDLITEVNKSKSLSICSYYRRAL